jgi:predicted solute-binding protein
VEKSLEECQRLSRTDFGRMDKLWEVWQEKKGEMWLPLDMVALKESLKQK